MNAGKLRTPFHISINAPAAQLSRGRYTHHMIRADPLRIMCSIDNPDLWIKVLDLINDGWRNLEIDIIQMHHIRMKILQDLPDLPSCIPGIDNLKWIS